MISGSLLVGDTRRQEEAQKEERRRKTGGSGSIVSVLLSGVFLFKVPGSRLNEPAGVILISWNWVKTGFVAKSIPLPCTIVCLA